MYESYQTSLLHIGIIIDCKVNFKLIRMFSDTPDKDVDTPNVVGQK